MQSHHYQTTKQPICLLSCIGVDDKQLQKLRG